MSIEPGHPEETCEMCGGRNMVWFAPSPIWNRVVRDPAAPLPEILCPQCFTEAYEKKFGPPTAWKVTTETEADMVSGRIAAVNIAAIVWHRAQRDVETWMDAETHAGRFRSSREAPGWSVYEKSCEELNVALRALVGACVGNE